MMQMIRTSTAVVAGVLVALMLVSCASSQQRDNAQLPESRPSDFTLGLVVFGDPVAADMSMRSARYIIEPGGTLRASFGAGSDGMTYPQITRRVSEDQLNAIWETVSKLSLEPQSGVSLGSGHWTQVQAPELFKRSDFRAVELGAGYLLEIRANGRWMAWESYMFLGGPTSFVEMLADLAWVTD